MFLMYNPNPDGNRVGDCVIRAISTATGLSWEQVYVELSVQGFILKDMPSSNHVWASYLFSKGYVKEPLPSLCPECYTVREFCEDHPEGIYILGTGSHAVAVIDGDWYDTWNSGDEVPVFYFRKE